MISRKKGLRGLAQDIARFCSDADPCGWRDEMLPGETFGESLERGAEEALLMLESGDRGVLVARIAELSEGHDSDIVARAEDLIRRMERPAVRSRSVKAPGACAGAPDGGFSAARINWTPAPRGNAWVAYVRCEGGVYRMAIDADARRGCVYAPAWSRGRGVVPERMVACTDRPFKDPVSCARELAGLLKSTDRIIGSAEEGEYRAGFR